MNRQNVTLFFFFLLISQKSCHDFGGVVESFYESGTDTELLATVYNSKTYLVCKYLFQKKKKKQNNNSTRVNHYSKASSTDITLFFHVGRPCLSGTIWRAGNQLKLTPKRCHFSFYTTSSVALSQWLMTMSHTLSVRTAGLLVSLFCPAWPFSFSLTLFIGRLTPGVSLPINHTDYHKKLVMLHWLNLPKNLSKLYSQ